MSCFTSTLKVGPRSLLPCLVVALVGLFNPLHGAILDEYDVKAGFLFNFVRFVQWPESALPPAPESLIIGILGSDPFGKTLDELVQGEEVAGHRIAVRRFTRANDYSKCHILFISQSEAPFLKEILARLKGRPILTVSDADRFANSGGAIGLVVEAGRVRLHVNVSQAKAARLGLSAKLLRPAVIISDPQSLLLPRHLLLKYVSDAKTEAIVARGQTS